MAAAGFSHIFSGCFVTLLIWGCTTVVCLVDEKLDVQPATTTGYQSIEMSPEPVHGVTSVPFACGNITGRCEDICNICRSLIDIPRIDCLYILYEQVCQLNFMSAMNFLQSSDWCRWSKVRSLYSNFSICTEEMSDCLLIPWPNSRVEQIFVDIHSEFFKDCPTEELSDPPEAIVFALVMTPICLIPIMVSLVVLKTKNGDGSS